MNYMTEQCACKLLAMQRPGPSAMIKKKHFTTATSHCFVVINVVVLFSLLF